MWATIPILALWGCGGAEAPPEEVQFTEPNLVVASPAEDAWVPAEPVTVAGTATGLHDLTVNGEPVAVSGGAFTTEVTLARGVNTLDVAALDDRGDAHFLRRTVLAGDFEPAGDAIEDAVWVRVNRPGIDQVIALATGMFSTDDITAAATAANPVYEDAYTVFGFDAATIRADITAISLDDIELRATPATGVLELVATLPNLQLDVQATGEVATIDYDVGATFWADPVVVEGLVTVDAVNGGLAVELIDPSVQLVGFHYDVSLLPWGIEDYLFVDAIEAYIEEMVVEQIVALVPPLLDELLSSLDLSLELDLLGTPVAVEAEFSSATIDYDGLQLGVDMRVDMPGDATTGWAGYLTTGAVEPELDRSAPIALSVSDDMMNAVLFEAWAAGVLELTLSTDDGSLDSFMLAPLKAEEGTIAVSAALPPVILEQQGELVAQLGGLGVSVATPGGELGEQLDLAIAGGLALDVLIDGEELKLNLGTPDLVLTVTDSDWGASNEATTRLVETMLPIDLLLVLLPDIALPLPTFEGVAISQADVQRNPSRAFTDVLVWLE
jgi:hypothetical protein